MTTKELSKLLDQFKKDTIAKFERGRVEHGENFEDIDYDEEIMGEIMDLLVYHWLQRKYVKSEAVTTRQEIKIEIPEMFKRKLNHKIKIDPKPTKEQLKNWKKI